VSAGGGVASLRSPCAPGAADERVAAPAGAFRVAVRAVPRSGLVLAGGRVLHWREAERSVPGMLRGRRDIVLDVSLPAPLREVLLRACVEGGARAWIGMPEGYVVPAMERDLAVAALWRPVAAHRALLRVREAVRCVGTFAPELAGALRRQRHHLRYLGRSELRAALSSRALAPVAAAFAPPGPWGLGAGDVIVAHVVRHLAHPLRFRNARRLWRYAGLSVDGGRAQRVRRGQFPAHNESLRSALMQLPGLWLCSASPWAEVWEVMLPRYVERHDARCGCGREGHARRMAWRQVVRIWLRDGWMRWREIAVHDAAEALRRWGLC
jgi:hypothetical protein